MRPKQDNISNRGGSDWKAWRFPHLRDLETGDLEKQTFTRKDLQMVSF